MTRAIPSALAALLAAEDVATAEILLLEARDGTIATFTTWDETVSADLNGEGDQDFTEGMVLSAITLAAGMDASFAEIDGAVGGQMTALDVEGGKWGNALAWLALISPGEDGFAPLLHGLVKDSRVEGERWIIEIRNQADRFNEVVGDQTGPLCRAEFGDARCGYAVPSYAATVTAGTSAMRFTVSTVATHADGFFDFGDATFTSGDLAGLPLADIFGWTSPGASAGVVTLIEPLPRAPQVGDTLDLRPGCAKTRAACMAYGNILNMRAEPDLPGTDQVLRYPVTEG